MQVWRILFWAMAGISVITCIMILTMAVEPRSINQQVQITTFAGTRTVLHRPESVEKVLMTLYLSAAARLP